MNILESINHFLPKIEIIIPKNEVDYYGFSYYLNQKLANRYYNYSFSSWVHGWIYNEHKFIDKFNISQYYPHLKIVADELQANFVKKHGVDNVVAAGYPYIYIDDNPNIKRFKNSLLIMPPKNSRDILTRWDEDEFINNIKNLKKDFENIFFCIDQVSIKNKMWIEKLKKNKFNFIVGADSRDSNSLLRMKIIFKHFEYVHSPTIGSAIVYAAYDGCKVSLSENYLEYSLAEYKNHPLYETNKEFVEYEIYSRSKDYIKKKFSFLFKDPLKSEYLNEWAENELGLKFRYNISEIPKLLGWRMRDKIRFYPMKYLNSLIKKIN